ncbi:HupE/UreJ family protein [Roseovarius pelagicus]|uniref:HupE/UreJ family protein n=1 Tax=Roseovarius pelagicus TaxID=2980108 RepID=A0ABY6D8A9_9RHOB|nr:HupE/UreJ family protein [Roseovarius pelagicus]UXX81423.1 HupE/UreJ family protein [Roseovarius pelagicus]
MRLRPLILFVLAIVIAPTLATAHRKGESYVYLNVGEASLSGRFEILLDDLGNAMALDDNGDGTVSVQEFEAHSADIYARMQPNLTFFIGDQSYPVEITGHDFVPVGFGIFATLNFTTAVSQAMPDAIEIEHRPYYAGGGPEQPVLLIIESNARSGLEGNEARHLLVFASETERRSVDLTAASALDMFKSFVIYGAKHILIGYDHLFFLLALLFPAVLVYRDRHWDAVEGLRPALMNVVAVVTLFTIAHSITLSLAALEILRLPERLIESLIAASIAIAAAANLIAAPRRQIWIVIFGFGLLHGMGFANVLAPYGVEPTNIVVTLFAFNVGVELGQILFVVLCVPLLYMLRKSRLYVPVVLYGGSSLLILIALYWFVERAFGVNMSVSSLLP